MQGSDPAAQLVHPSTNFQRLEALELSFRVSQFYLLTGRATF